MRVVVQVWCEIDPTLNVRVDRTSGAPVAEPGDQLLRVSPLGQAGIAVARSLPGAGVTAFALGEGHREALRHALAAGAERAVEISRFSVARLADWVRAEADLLIADRLAGALAARLDWSHLAGLSDLRREHERLHAVRHLGRGDRERVSARLPAAVRLYPPVARPPYLARARLARVAAASIEALELGGTTSDAAAVTLGPLEPTRPRTRVAALPTAAGSASSRLQALLRGPATPRNTSPTPAKTTEPLTPEQMADELVRYLRHHDLLPDLD